MRGRRRLRRTSQATYAAASSWAGHVRATRFSSPRRPTAPVPPQALRAAQAVAAAAIGSIFLAVTTVLLPVRAGGGLLGIWAARCQPGRLLPHGSSQGHLLRDGRRPCTTNSTISTFSMQYTFSTISIFSTLEVVPAPLPHRAAGLVERPFAAHLAQ